MGDQMSPPVIDAEPITMDFYEALKQAAKGEKITRLSWKPEVSYGVMIDGMLTLFIHGEFKQWIINDGDMEGTDWVIFEPNE